MDIREAILTQPMRRTQIGIILICILLTMIDGYEVLVMAFVAPHLAKAWGLGPVQVGYLLSAGIFGMAVGAAFISPLADKLGRRRHIILCLALITVGMGLSAIAANVFQMVLFRAFAGLFIGAIVSSLNIVVSEYSSDKRRGTVMGIYGIGLPAGVAMGGAVTGTLIAMFDWRAPFVFGAVITAVMLFVVMVALPESIEYLIEKRPKGALDQYNKIADKLGYPRAAELPPAMASTQMRVVRTALFSGVMLPRTLFLWGGYACLIAAFYFANTWTAKLISDATGDPKLGGTTGVLIAIGGVLGALLFAGISLVIRPRMVTVLLMFGGAIAYVLYAHHFQTVGLALTLALFVGVFANGGVAAFYAISPFVYPTAVRGAGVGLMIGFGRAVAILVPIFTGYLLKAGWTPQGAYQFFAAVLVVAGIATMLLDRTYRGCSENPETPEAPKELSEPSLSVRLP
jgi:benzoate transport